MTNLDSFQSLSNKILSGRYSMADDNWPGAIDHFANVIKFRLEKDEIVKWQQTAIDYIKKEFAALVNDHSVPANDKNKVEAMSKWADIHHREGYYNSPEFTKLVNETRQKLVFADWVKTNLK